MKFVLFLFGDGDAYVLAGDVLAGDVLAGDVLSLAVGSGLGGHVGGTEYLPPRRLCMLLSS